MPSFQAKTGWESLRNCENKNYCSDYFLPDPYKEFQKKAKKFEKLKNWIMASFQAKTGW